MIELPSKTGLFRTSKGAISAKVHIIHPSVVIIGMVTSGASGILPGHVLIRNRSLKKRSAVEAEWMHYLDLYSALRGMVHALRNGGMQPDVKNGDAQELKVIPKTLRRCSRLIFSSASYNEFVEQASQEGIEYIIETLKRRQDDALAGAYRDVLRGIQQNDSLGRKNVGASAMAFGGAIHQMSKREQGARLIMSILDHRVYRLTEIIYGTLDLYESLLEALGGRDVTKVSEQAIFVRISEKQTYRVSEVRRATELLEEYIKAFDRVFALPHVRNVRHMRKDLVGMRSHLRILADHWDTESAHMLKGFIAVLRQGILWFLARHRLEVLRARLSWALGDQARGRKVIRKVVHAPKHEVIDIISPEDQTRFDVIRRQLRECQARLNACNDHLLERPVKQHVLLQTRIALHCAERGAWLETKARLKLATAKL